MLLAASLAQMQYIRPIILLSHYRPPLNVATITLFSVRVQTEYQLNLDNVSYLLCPFSIKYVNGKNVGIS